MLYNLSNPVDRERFKTRCHKLQTDQANVELTQKRYKNNHRQTRYLHQLFAWFAIETGNTPQYVKNQYFKRLCNSDIFLRQTTDKYLGEIEILRSIADLDTQELTLATERFRTWSIDQAGVYLPADQDTQYLNHIENETQRYQNH